MTPLGFINFYILQWFFIRAVRMVHGDITNESSLQTVGIGVTGFVYPMSGWDRGYRTVGKRRYTMMIHWEFQCPKNPKPASH